MYLHLSMRPSFQLATNSRNSAQEEEEDQRQKNWDILNFAARGGSAPFT
jgi:hypothetical protein